jgi:hypothetical protein
MSYDVILMSDCCDVYFMKLKRMIFHMPRQRRSALQGWSADSQQLCGWFYAWSYKNPKGHKRYK